MTRYTGQVTFPIMYQVGNVEGEAHESNHRFSDPSEGQANTRKWESYPTKAQEQGDAVPGTPNADRSRRPVQSGEGIGPIRPTGFDADHDYVPSRPPGIGSNLSQVGCRGIEAGTTACHTAQERNAEYPSTSRAGAASPARTESRLGTVPLRVLLRTGWTDDGIQCAEDDRSIGSDSEAGVSDPSPSTASCPGLQTGRRWCRHQSDTALPRTQVDHAHCALHSVVAGPIQELFPGLDTSPALGQRSRPIPTPGPQGVRPYPSSSERLAGLPRPWPRPANSRLVNCRWAGPLNRTRPDPFNLGFT